MSYRLPTRNVKVLIYILHAERDERGPAYLAGKDYYQPGLYDYYEEEEPLWASPSPSLHPRVSVLKNTNIEAEMSARRQVEVMSRGRRVHYATKEVEEEEEEAELEYEASLYHRYQSPSPGPRQRQQHPAVHRSRRTYSEEREGREGRDQARYYNNNIREVEMLCEDEMQYNA